jgi:hypothetical protein
VRTLGSDTLGWLNRLPPAMRVDSAAAKPSIAELTCARPETFAWMEASRFASNVSFGALAALARSATRALISSPDPAPSAYPMEVVMRRPSVPLQERPERKIL